jgi:hypothetical protein
VSTEDEIRGLVDAHPELDADELAAAYRFFASEDPSRWPPPYTDDERQADEIVTAYLAHEGAEWVDGIRPEPNRLTGANLVERLGLVAEVPEDDPLPSAVIPLPTFLHLLRAVVASIAAEREPDESVMSRHLRKVERREMADAAGRAFVAHHPDGRQWFDCDDEPPSRDN